jgi:hypothetical protein
MPFKSKAQERYFRHLLSKGEISKKTFEEWLSKSPKRLPEKKAALSAAGPNVPLIPKISLEELARSMYYNQLIRALYSPGLDENRKQDIIGALRDRATYGVRNPHVGIPPKTFLNKLRMKLFGGMGIEPELKGES